MNIIKYIYFLHHFFYFYIIFILVFLSVILFFLIFIKMYKLFTLFQKKKGKLAQFKLKKFNQSKMILISIIIFKILQNFLQKNYVIIFIFTIKYKSNNFYFYMIFVINIRRKICISCKCIKFYMYYTFYEKNYFFIYIMM